MRSLTAANAIGAALTAFVVGCGAASCGDRERPHAVQSPAPAPRPALRLVAMTDVDGYLEPCGCQSRPLGGIDKAAARLRALGEDGVPTLLLSAGNLFFAPEDHAGQHLDGSDDEIATQAKAQAQTLATILGKLSLAAAAPGAADTKFGPAELQGLSKRGGFPLLCAGSAARADRDGADAPCEPSAIVVRGGVRIGVWGLGGGDEAAAGDLVAAAKQRTDALRAGGAELVVGLWSGSGRLARRIAGATSGLSFLVQGGADSPDVLPPERIGQTVLLRAGHRGQGLLIADVFPSGAGAFSDIGAWARNAQQKSLEGRIADLDARVREWQRDPKVDRAQLADQEARLAALRAELSGLRTAARPAGSVFSAQFVELGPEVSGDPAIRAELEAHDKRVNEHNREAFANIAPKPVPKGMPGYVGAVRCGECHEEAFAWWKGHAHGRAYHTLEVRNKQFSLSCVGCHVTGYNQPGGATVVQNAGLIDVGCESCHGPGSMHAADPDADADKNVRRDTAAAVCLVCHSPEHSDKFEYATYKARLIVPGHGLPVEKAAP